MNTQASLILITSLLATGKNLSYTDEVHRKAINNLWAHLRALCPSGIISVLLYNIKDAGPFELQVQFGLSLYWRTITWLHGK